MVSSNNSKITFSLFPPFFCHLEKKVLVVILLITIVEKRGKSDKRRCQTKDYVSFSSLNVDNNLNVKPHWIMDSF